MIEPDSEVVTPLLFLMVDLNIAHMLDTLRILVLLCNDLVAAELGPDSCPAKPVEYTEE